MSELYYKNHIFCCINQKDDGKKSCGASGAEDIQSYMKKQAKELGLKNTRINKSGCLGRCSEGPVIVVYPEGTWLHCDSKKAADRVLEALAKGEKMPKDLVI